jgi:K+-sensing histidine kinase KdpD
MNESPQPQEPLVPLERVSKFVRQLTHDVRNGLSAMDLETAFIAEIATEPEVHTELRKLREMITGTAQMLRRMSQNFQPVTAHPIPWAASTMMEELRKQLEKEFPAEVATVVVENRFGTEMVHIDLNQTLAAAFAVLRNAFQFRQEGALVQVIGRAEKGQAILEIREPKPALQNEMPPEQWSTVPLRSTRPGGYGLGLYRARQIAEAQGGQLNTSFTGTELVTRITLPNDHHD